LYSNTGFANLSTIEFYVANYGSESETTLAVLLSKDGENWVDLELDIQITGTLTKVTIDLSTNEAFANSDLSTSDELRIKFVVGGVVGGTSKKRLNIDDITLFKHVAE
jgi:hypothetical protein